MEFGEGEKFEPKYPPNRVTRIVREFYASSKNGLPIENEAEKAKVLLEYIQHLQKKYDEISQPMGKKEIAALGFDLGELKNGKIRAAR